jgi:hypothetical protein
MGVYFARIDLAEADQRASVLGAFIALAGLALALYGTLAARRTDRARTPQSESTAGTVPDATLPNDETGTVRPEPGGVHNVIGGGTFHAPVIQGRDIGGVNFGTPIPPPVPPQPPATPPAEG